MSTMVIILASIGILAMFGYMITELSGDKNKKVNH